VWGANPSRRLIQSYSGGDNWLPYPDRDQAIDLYGRHFEAAVNVPLDNQYGIFTPDEINRTLEMRNAFYLRLDFAGDGNLPFSGNVGLRYLKMERQALGIVEFPLIVPRTHELQQFPPDSLSQPLNGEMVENYLRQQVANGTYPDFYQAATAAENNWIYNPYFFLASEIRGFTQGVALIGSD